MTSSLQECFAAQELHYEEELCRNPYNLKLWWNFLNYKKDAKAVTRYIIYERALKHLPRSYKLWHEYLYERTQTLENRCPSLDKRFSHLINTYERCLVNLHKMPRIWLDYCQLLIRCNKGTETRRAFDRALQSLPVTQHKELWTLYIEWACQFGVQETAVRVFRRFLMFEPSRREDFVTYLEEIGQYEEAAKQLSICVDDDHFVSPSGQSKHQIWMKLCDLCANHAKEVANVIKVEAIIRSGISRFSDEVGKLWCRLADFYIRQGLFEKARDVFEEAINSVVTVRDFTIVFDAYVKTEESVVSSLMRLQSSQGSDMHSDSDSDDSEDEADEAAEREASTADLEMRLARLEFLTDKRALLLNSVILRQNPHNVNEWHKRIKLFHDDIQRSLLTYVEAVKTVDPKLATGKLSSLWLSFARYYEGHHDLENSRTVLSKATEVNFSTVEELADVWCAWAEMELRCHCPDQALAVLQRAVTEPVSSIKRRKAQAAAQGKGEHADHFEGAVTADRLYKNIKVWAFYLDLEESLESVTACRAAYDRVMDLKVITPQIALNYATYLKENNYFEDSFCVYERALVLFSFPQVKAIWLTYLDEFIQRYAGTKLERLRDLFEQAVANVPVEDAAEFYLKYAKAEEQFGMARHAMAVYDRCTRVVPDNSRLNMYRLYIKKVEIHYGATKTRPVFERAISELNESNAMELCVDYAELERKLGEVDRARAIYQHGSQLADPRKAKSYWLTWREFEEAHGNEDTFRDMLRVQRSVETVFCQVNYLAAEMASEMAGAAGAGGAVPASMCDLDAIAEKQAQERSLEHKRKFVAAGASGDGDDAPPAATKPRSKNPDEINIDEDEVDDDAAVVREKPIPQAVFGSVNIELN